jgi:hypothetical protein
MIRILWFRRKKTETAQPGEEDGRRGLISHLEEENAKGRANILSLPIRKQFQVNADSTELLP